MTTLARLSFWIPSGRIDDFAEAYERQCVSILTRHGLVASAEEIRPTVEGVFSRLFAVESPAEVTHKEDALRTDPAWWEVLQRLRVTFGTSEDLLGFRFGGIAGGRFFGFLGWFLGLFQEV